MIQNLEGHVMHVRKDGHLLPVAKPTLLHADAQYKLSVQQQLVRDSLFLIRRSLILRRRSSS